MAGIGVAVEYNIVGGGYWGDSQCVDRDESGGGADVFAYPHYQLRRVARIHPGKITSIFVPSGHSSQKALYADIAAYPWQVYTRLIQYVAQR